MYIVRGAQLLNELGRCKHQPPWTGFAVIRSSPLNPASATTYPGILVGLGITMIGHPDSQNRH